MLLFALLIGVVAGLRAMTPLAAVAWGAAFGLLPVGGSWFAFLGWRFTAPILTVLALGELVTDQLPSTPSRKVPMQFGARLVSGGISGAAIGITTGQLLSGGIAGIVGGVIGTLGGAAARARLAAALGRDLPAALIEDAVAILLAFLVVAHG